MFVNSAGLRGCQLRLLLGLLLNFCNLLSLLRGGRDLHAQDNVSDLGLRQGCNVHTEREDPPKSGISKSILNPSHQGTTSELPLRVLWKRNTQLFGQQEGPNHTMRMPGKVWCSDFYLPY